MSRNEALSLLAGQMHCPTDLPPDQIRATLEHALRRLIRCALRSGRGVPRLVQWVRQNAPPADSSVEGRSPDAAAPSLARQLCGLLLEQIERGQAVSVAAQETVVGW